MAINATTALLALVNAWAYWEEPFAVALWLVLAFACAMQVVADIQAEEAEDGETP